MSTQNNVVETIMSRPAWGRKQIEVLPYADKLVAEMYKINKTNLGSKEVLHLVFGYKAAEVGFTYYNEFIDMMKIQRTMINREDARLLLRSFWNNTNEDYRHDPSLFYRIKEVIVQLNAGLTNSNSTQQLRLRFMEAFLEYDSGTENQ